jgi:hypothetical protein
VGSLLVKDRDELIEATLLLQGVLGSRLGGFLLEREVHALVAAVLLRMAGLYALEVDVEAQPPRLLAKRRSNGDLRP